MLFKYYVIKGGVSQKLTFAHRGDRGVLGGAKSAHVIQQHIFLKKFTFTLFKQTPLFKSEGIKIEIQKIWEKFPIRLPPPDNSDFLEFQNV